MLISLLQGRLINCEVQLKKAKHLVELSSQTYDHIVDHALNEHSNKLNRILKCLAALTVIFIPFQVVSAFFGMNVVVPFGHVQSLWPFFLLFVVCCCISAVLLLTFKFLQWL